MGGPALPWACPDEPANIGSAPAENPPAVSLTRGGRIKVLWEIHTNEGERNKKWWGASVLGDVTAAGARATLRYDALGEFEEEEAEVIFLSCVMLKDCSSEAEMHWAREEDIPDIDEDEEPGEEHGMEEEDQEEEPGEEHGMEEEVDLQQLCALYGQPGAQREDAAEVERQAMQHLPMDKQLRVAEGVRKFLDHVSSQIKAKAEASGEQTFVVTEADVNEIVGGLGLPKK